MTLFGFAAVRIAYRGIICEIHKNYILQEQLKLEKHCNQNFSIRI